MGWQNFFTLAGGLGLFLYGMKFMGDELERAAGKSLRNLLEVLTRNRFLGLLVGLVFTMLIQSSSATSVMVIGFAGVDPNFNPGFGGGSGFGGFGSGGAADQDDDISRVELRIGARRENHRLTSPDCDNRAAGGLP